MTNRSQPFPTVPGTIVEPFPFPSRGTVRTASIEAQPFPSAACADCGASNVVMVGMQADVRGNPVRLCRACYVDGLEPIAEVSDQRQEHDKATTAELPGLEVKL